MIMIEQNWKIKILKFIKYILSYSLVHKIHLYDKFVLKSHLIKM